jgi:hypothetical protein
MKEFLTDGGNTLLGKLKTEKDPKAAVTQLVRSAYGRSPTDQELKALTAFVEKRADRPAEAYRQLLWVLVTNSEFRFNY